MLFEIFKFELKYRARRPDTYIYFTLLTLSSLVAIDFIYEGTLGPIKANAPYVIATAMSILSAFFMMIASMIMGVAILRDFDHNMASLMFVNPIKKWAYLLGRFLGSFVVLIIIFTGVLWGLMLSEFLPWREAENLLAFKLWSYLQPFLCIVLPTLFLGGAIFFVSGAISRKLVVVYTQGILLFLLYQAAMMITRGSGNTFMASILDPFSFQTINAVVQFWTPVERNSMMLPIGGLLLYNRLIWISIGVIVLLVGYYGFSFNIIRGISAKKVLKVVDHPENPFTIDQKKMELPVPNLHLDSIKAKMKQTTQLALFHFKLILKEPSFWAIIICGVLIIFINSISLGTSYGVPSQPVSYVVIEELQEMSVFFFLIILVFYSGELIWKERDIKVNLIVDALPTSNFVRLAGKFSALVLMYVLLMMTLILSGISFQTLHTYYDYDLKVYFVSFFLATLPFLLLFTIASFLFQILSNHKFLGHILLVIFFIVTISMGAFGFDHPLYVFGGSDLGAYSDMNAYGHFLIPYNWIKLYWMAFGIFLFVICVLLSVRGTEAQLKDRIQMGKLRLSNNLIYLILVTLLIFTLSGCYIYYNTNLLNKYLTHTEEESHRAAYEKALKGFEYLAQPKIVEVNLKVELYPTDRNYTTAGYFILTNEDSLTITEIHIQQQPNDQIKIEHLHFEGGATLTREYEQYRYFIYHLNEPLHAGDSLQMNFQQTFTTKGFRENSATSIVENGTFFSSDHFPTLGYNRNIELRDDDIRSDYDLAPRISRAKRDDTREVTYGRSGGDGYEINFEIVIGTDSSQIALAPGSLLKEWEVDDRRYFHYKMEQPMINFYSIVSARYEVMRDAWVPSHDSLGIPVDLEIYYHPGHEYNLDRMMKAMKVSFDYYSKHFSPYQYGQLRIMEFPRYESFAQSFPGTIPFSEAIGFILDIDDQQDVDMASFITAHELAHQWWGLQLVAANVEGRHFILESLAQYSALMVLKELYPAEKIHQLLQRELRRYLTGRANEANSEMPLAQVKSQQYIHYGKGIINLYALQDYISEEKVNLALKRFLRDWNFIDGRLQTDRYATTLDLLDYFKEVTPDSLQYIISDLFERVTLYENKSTTGNFEQLTENQYRVNLTVDATKYSVDYLGVASPIGMKDWVDIGVYANGNYGKDSLIYLEKHHIREQFTTLEILVDKKPTTAGIDPLHKLIDRKTENNVVTLTEKEGLN